MHQMLVNWTGQKYFVVFAIFQKRTAHERSYNTQKKGITKAHTSTTGENETQVPRGIWEEMSEAAIDCWKYSHVTFIVAHPFISFKNSGGHE
jgi:hypothetical protein